MGQLCTLVMKNFKYCKRHFVMAPLIFIVIPCFFIVVTLSADASRYNQPVFIFEEEGTLFPRANDSFTVFYYPKNSKSSDLIKTAKKINRLHELSSDFRGFKTEKEAVREAKKREAKNKQAEQQKGGYYLDIMDGLLFVHFRNLTGSDVRYEIVTPLHSGTLSSRLKLNLQSVIEAAIIEQKTKVLATKRANWTLKNMNFPTKCTKSKELVIAPVWLPAVLGVIFLMGIITAEMCEEKATGLLEFLLIAGVARWKIKCGWFIFTSAFLFPVLIATVLVIKFFDRHWIKHTSVFLILVWFILYWLALFCLCCCMASFFSKPRRAAMIAPAIIFLPIPLLYWLIPAGFDFAKMIVARITCLIHPVVPFLIGFSYIHEWESHMTSVGLYSPYPEDQFGGLLESLLYLIFQCFVFILLSFYFDHVAPSKYGVKWPAYFFFLPSFWFPEKNVHQSKDNNQTADIELTQMGKEVGVNILSLSKSYGKGQTAVDGLTVSFFRNEITALLGHNGAGKSTTMNMLTGMTSPTSGTATVNGYDIRRNMDKVRKGLGFCPQHDIFYTDLSVIDHMYFYGSLRGMSTKAIGEHSKSLLERMNMMQALKTPAGRLSGGMKRKLCIAIALIGQPSVIILDEPTSAIDPVSRKAIWDIIIQYKSTNQATILISTHYMQEADLLADRIAIIDNGSLRCFGSSMWLKRNYGEGSKLTVAHQGSLSSPQALQEALRQYVPVTLESFSGTEAKYALPMEAARSPNLADAFLFLEGQGRSFGVSSFGISESTMEQVFFNVSMGKEQLDDDEGLKKLDEITYKKRTGCLLLLTQLAATWVKRFHFSRRAASFYILQFVAPLMIIALSVMGAKLSGSDSRQAKTELKLVHPWIVPGQRAVFYAGEENTDFITVLMEEGIGTRCMKGTPVPSGDKGGICSLKNLHFPSKTTDSKEVGCTCESCPSVAVPAHQELINSNVLLTNLIDRNISNYLLKQPPHDTFIGGVEIIGRNEYQIWAGAGGDEGRPLERLTKRQLELRHNTKSSFLNAFNNVLLKTFLKQSENTKFAEYGITLYTKESSVNLRDT